MKDSKRPSSRIALVALLAAALLGVTALGLAGCGSGAAGEESSAELERSTARYRAFLRENAAELSRRLTRMTAVIERESGKEPVPAAETVYPGTHLAYGRLDPFAQLYPGLQRRIDGLEEETPPQEYGGFHRIEKQVYWQKVTAELTPVVKQLSADVAQLRRRIDSAELRPEQLLTGTRRTVDGIVANVFPGDAERWAHSDLIDAAAETEGVEAAFAAAQPLLAEADPELAKKIEAQIAAVGAAVGEYGTFAREDDPSEPLRAGTGFVIYDQVTQDKRWALAAPFKELAALLGEAEEELGES